MCARVCLGTLEREIVPLVRICSCWYEKDTDRENWCTEHKMVQLYQALKRKRRN